MTKNKTINKNVSKIYHATNEHIAKEACVKGLLPYDVPLYENGTPRNVVASSVESISLTSVYPAVLAFDLVGFKERWGIIEIDISLLEENMFAPHELFLQENVKFTSEEDQVNNSSRLRQEASKKRKKWKNSLESCGFCLYTKEIPLKAITKVSIYDPCSNWVMTKAMLNFNIANHESNFNRHQMASKWLLGSHLVGSQWVGSTFSRMPYSEQSKITSVLQNKNGLDIYYFGSTNSKSKSSY